MLLVLEHAAEGRAALRAGQCDFLVNDLDEAVRILRNEVRRGAAVSVCLQNSLTEVQRTAATRGLQPDLLDTHEAALESRGARLQPACDKLQSGERLVCWSASRDNACDLMAAACLPADDWERQRWLREAPRMLGRSRQHVRAVPLLQHELKRLREKAAQAPEPCVLWVAPKEAAAV